MTRWVRRVLVAAALAAFATAARAGERIERLLPATTFMYGGVEKLEAGYDKLLGAMQRALPDFPEFQQDRVVLEIAREFGLEGVRNRQEALEQTGLDPGGPAGIAWVLSDPSVDPGRNLNENALVILPVKDAVRAERVLAQRMLPMMRQSTGSICRSTIQRIQRAKDYWRRMNQDAGEVEVTWERLAEANPGLKPLRCPGGGEYMLGTLGGEAVCTVHAQRGEMEPAAGPVGRERLGVRKVGDVTLVGGRKVGMGYAFTASHLVLTNNMNVLEDAVAAAAGEGKRADIAPPGPGFANADGRGYVQMDFLLGWLRHEIARWARRRAPTPAAERFLTLLEGTAGLTADAQLTGSLTATLSWRVKRNAQTARVLDKKPTKLEAFALVPDTALAAWGANLARETFSVIGDIALIVEPEVAAPCKLVMAACDGDGAFALTEGTLADEIPNLLFILRVRDREASEAAAECWLAIFAHELARGEERAGRLGLQRREVDGVEVWSLEGLRRGVSVHYAFVGPFAVFGSKLDDLRAVIALHKGQAKNALVASGRYRKLELPEGTANVISFVDMPALIRQIVQGEEERRQHWRNERCRQNMQRLEQLIEQFRRQANRPPATFDELRNPPRVGGRHQVQDWCQMFGQELKLILDPKTGKVTCPLHGTVAEFKLAEAGGEVRQMPGEALVLSAFGLWALHIRVEGGQIVADGRLIPVPQRRPEPRPTPPRPQRPVGPAEF